MKIINPLVLSGCSSLTTVTIPNGVTSIGDNAFSNCSSLTSITIPDGVISIGSYVFLECNSLTSVTITNSVTSIGEATFLKCESLNEINVDSNNKNFSSINGVLYSNNNTVLIRYPEGKMSTDFTIPSGVQSINYEAFSACDKLSTLLIPNTVTAIGYSAFSGCSSLSTLTIPDSVASINSSAFNGCNSLESINVDANNVNYSSLNGVFFNKSKTTLIQYPAGNSQTSFTISESISAIENSAFFRCSKLEAINAEETNPNYSSIDGVLFNKNKTAIIQYPSGKSSTAYTIPEGITSIYNYAFLACKNLIEVTMSESLTNISNSAFAECSSLISVTIPKNVTEISGSAFRLCTNLTSVTVLGYVSNIGSDIFSNFPNVTIYGYKYSDIQKYANQNDINFVEIQEVLFPDLGGVEWAQSSINYLYNSGIINGYEDGTFRPENNITRGEFVKLLVVAFGIYNPEAVSKFTDLPEGEWYNSYIASAEEAGLAEGNGDGKFSPDSSITREEMFVFCARAIKKYRSIELLSKYNPEITTELDKFVDGSSVSDWAKEYVATVTKNNLVKGSPVENGNALFPQNLITRAEVAVVLYRAYLMH